MLVIALLEGYAGLSGPVGEVKREGVFPFIFTSKQLETDKSGATFSFCKGFDCVFSIVS